jgi:hypothetical protein
MPGVRRRHGDVVSLDSDEGDDIEVKKAVQAKQSSRKAKDTDKVRFVWCMR